MITKTAIPNFQYPCPMVKCVYQDRSMCDNDDTRWGLCDNPLLNHGNSDALCFDMKPSKIVNMIGSHRTDRLKKMDAWFSAKHKNK